MPAANPFDQFDPPTIPAGAPNPFDAYDNGGTSVAVAPAPVAEVKRPSFTEAFRKSKSPSFQQVMVGGNPIYNPSGTIDTTQPTGIAATTPEQAMAQAQMLKSMLLNGGGPAAGQSLGAMTGPFAPAAVPILGGIGGAAGNALDQYTRPGNQPFKWGELLTNAGLGAVPGSFFAKGGIPTQMLKGAGTGALAKTAQTAIDDQRLPTAEEVSLAAGLGGLAAPIAKFVDSGNGPGSIEAAANAKQSAGFIDKATQMKQAGLLIPSMSNPATGLSDSPAVQALLKNASHTELEQAVVFSNSQKAGELTREYAGLPKDAPLTQETFDAAAKPALEVYQKVADISPEAAIHLEEYKAARDQARSLWQDAKSPIQPNRTEKISQAKDAEIMMQAKQFQLMDDAHRAGKFDLMPELTQAQKDLARNYAAQNATDMVRGVVDPRDFMKMRDRGVPLDGNALLLADAAEASPRWMKPPSELSAIRPAQNMGTSTRFGKALALVGKGTSAGIGAYIGSQFGHTEAGAMAGYGIGASAAKLQEAMTGSATDKLLKYAANPKYTGNTGKVDPEFLANVTRYMTMNAGQQNPTQ